MFFRALKIFPLLLLLSSCSYKKTPYDYEAEARIDELAVKIVLLKIDNVKLEARILALETDKFTCEAKRTIEEADETIEEGNRLLDEICRETGICD